MNEDDVQVIRAALALLPAECRYHGAGFDEGGIFAGGSCCDTGRASLARKRAEETLQRATKTAP